MFQWMLFHLEMVENMEYADEIYYGSYKYPDSATDHGWLFASLPLVAGVIVGIIHSLLVAKGNLEKVGM